MNEQQQRLGRALALRDARLHAAAPDIAPDGGQVDLDTYRRILVGLDVDLDAAVGASQLATETASRQVVEHVAGLLNQLGVLAVLPPEVLGDVAAVVMKATASAWIDGLMVGDLHGQLREGVLQ